MNTKTYHGLENYLSVSYCCSLSYSVLFCMTSSLCVEQNRTDCHSPSSLSTLVRIIFFLLVDPHQRNGHRFYDFHDYFRNRCLRRCTRQRCRPLHVLPQLRHPGPRARPPAGRHRRLQELPTALPRTYRAGLQVRPTLQPR